MMSRGIFAETRRMEAGARPADGVTRPGKPKSQFSNVLMVCGSGLAHTRAQFAPHPPNGGGFGNNQYQYEANTMIQHAIDTCPMCNATPDVTGRWRFQVRCACGACGPKMHTKQDAIVRWSSVVHYVAKLRGELFAVPLMGHKAA
jgi:hypothetical protein